VVAPDNRVELRRITRGQAYAGELVVDSGLEPDEQVIVEGIQKVRPGMLVDAKLAPRPSMEQGGEAKQAAAPDGEPPKGAGDDTRGG
ncbi:MAG: efflux transporter periplasmic adaptor subunit, partial [Gammaproteobacteria bacterium]|nr:efflux transporter periplasmic adaptor subunit [Gammaproteobacteria bacterium]